MKKLALAVVPMVLLLTLALGGCGKAASDGGPNSSPGTGNGGGCKTTQTISLDPTDFVDKCVTVSANQPVTFDDNANGGGVHIICTGSNGTCQANSNAPSDLAAPGFTIQPGQTKVITFATPGTYKLACTVHPNMNITVTVQ